MKLRIALLPAIVLFIGICAVGTMIEKKANPTTEKWQAEIINQGPPSSINPPHDIIIKNHKQSSFGFGMKLARAIKWHQKQGHIIMEVRIIFYAHDGLNWRQGDISEAWIYYEEGK